MNLSHALRSLRKNALVTVMAVVSLALGIGASTAIFSLMDQLILRMLPVEHPQQLVQLASRSPEIGATWGEDRMSYPMYLDFRDKASVFSGVLAWYATPASLSYGGRTEPIRSELVTGDYFQVLGVRPAIGRTFTPEDNITRGAEPFVILTYDYWKSRFGADPDIDGRSLVLNGRSMTVIGVSAQGFHGLEIGDATQVFVPIVMQPQIAPDLSLGPRTGLELRRSRWVNVFARLKAGITAEQAQAAIAPLYRQIIDLEVQEPPFQKESESARQQYLKSRMDVFDGSTGRSSLRRDFTKPLYVLMAITGMMLLIACANVANLLIARATARQREIALRLALGASRTQIVMQLMIESLLLSAAATAAGVGLGVWIDRILLRFIAVDPSQLTLTAALDSRVLAFSIAIAFATAFIFGLTPALQASRPHLSETLKSEAGHIFGGRRQAHARKALVMVQVSISLLLLIASSLFVRSLSKLRDVDPGFRKDHVITFSIDPALNGYDRQHVTRFNQDLLDRLRTLPGVRGAGQAVQRVLAGGEWRNGITVEGYEPPLDERPLTHFNAVSPHYFDTLGIPLLAGRDFEPRDIGSDLRVCIVNESFARKYFAASDAVGRHIGMGNTPGTKTNIEIVGVVHDAKYDKLRGDTPVQMFVPFALSVGTVVYVRTDTDPAVLFGAVRAAVRELDENLPLSNVRTLEEQVDLSLVTDRMIAVLSSAFGSVATLLALVGLYSVISFTVTRRTKEIGIRIALGARSGNVVGMMMQDVAMVMLIGIGIAIPAYLALARYIRSQLFGIEAADPVQIAAAALFLLAVGLAAGYIPSRRALRIDPMRVLRYD